MERRGHSQLVFGTRDRLVEPRDFIFNRSGIDVSLWHLDMVAIDVMRTPDRIAWGYTKPQ